MLSLCLFNFHAEYIMQIAELDEAQAGIKISGRNISSLKYSDDTSLMAESAEELKGLLTRVKEESEKAGLTLNIKKTKSWHSLPTLQANRWGKSDNMTEFIFLGSEIIVNGDCAMKLKDTCFLEGKL